MKTFVLIGAALLIGSGVASAQRHKLTINAETPEGQLLQQIGTEADPAKKLGMLEEFASKYPKHEAAAWVYAQMQPAYVKANNFDKAIESGEKLLAIDPDDVEIAVGTLKAAEAKKDLDLIKKYSNLTSAAAKKTVALPKPADEDDVAEWKEKVDFAKQVDTYSEYSLYAAALTSTNPAKTIELVETLEQRNANSQYLGQALPPYFRALLQSGNAEKAAAIAEKAMAAGAADEDMLLAIADTNLRKNQNHDKVVGAAQKAVEVINAKAKPDGVADADWAKMKNSKLGLAHWMTGMSYSAQSKFGQADTALRAALPLLDNDQLKAAALFNLGLANYRLGDAAKGDAQSARILDALRFNQQCAAIKSQFQAQAAKNVAAIKSQYRLK
ncbi:MAG: hypothetical protein SFV54_13105 [Bryobacteraceae bacterium]|nr:hypothetical protein [Bryobacteraceae bacterium]